MITASGVTATPLAPRIASAKTCASAAETSVLSDSAASDVFAVPKMPQRASSDAFSAPAETGMTNLSWAAGRHGMSSSMFTADASAGEFTRGMEQLARAPEDTGVTSRAAAVQDEYLMKLLATRPAAVAPPLPNLPKQPAAVVTRPYSGDVSVVTGPSPAAGHLQKQATLLVEGSSAAAKSALGSEGFAGLRAQLLKHQDVFLQQIFDLHRCVRRQQQLVAVCDQPDALAEALQFLQGPPANPAAVSGSAPATVAASTPADPLNAQPERPAAAQHASVAQPLPAAMAAYAQYGHMAPQFGGPVYSGAPLQPSGPAPFDPLAAWYCRHYAPPPPYACAAAAVPALSQPPPAASFQAFGAHSAGAGYGSACGGYGSAGPVAMSVQAGMPPCSASAGGRPTAMAALDGAVAAAPLHGDRWWQDPAQVFGPAGVPALVARASTLQAQSGGVGGAGSMRRGNEAQSHLKAKANTMMDSDSMPLKKRVRSFTTHDDGERTGTASGSNSPGKAGSSQPPCAPKSAAKRARNGPVRKRRGTSSSSGVCGGSGKGSDSSGVHGPSPGALQSAASVLLSFSAMTE